MPQGRRLITRRLLTDRGQSVLWSAAGTDNTADRPLTVPPATLTVPPAGPPGLRAEISIGGENEMETSTADDSIVMVDSDRIEDDIDDMIVIDEGDDDEEENKTDAEQKEISRETHDSGTKHDSAVGTSAGVKHEEAATVRVFPVNLEDMREQKETWNDLCNMAVMAEYRKTKGVITRGQVNLEQTKSGKAIFQTASSLETEKYLDAYHKISVDYHRIRQEKIHRELNPLERKRGPRRKQSGSQVADANADFKI
nr:hypothetical protein BaRGS_027049 [Batillaria attramentaria]